MAYFVLPLLMLLLVPTIKSDPDPLQDFCVADTKSSTVFINGFPCINPNTATAKDFTTSILSNQGNTSSNMFGSSVVLITPQVLPGINTLGVVFARVDVGVGGEVPPHTHPRASEIVFVLHGTLTVGFVDTTNKLFSADIKTGDVFLFPKALVHFVQNRGDTTASLIGAFNSQAPGAQIIPLSVFASNPAIPNQVLAKAFQINAYEVDTIRKNLGGT